MQMSNNKHPALPGSCDLTSEYYSIISTKYQIM